MARRPSPSSERLFRLVLAGVVFVCGLVYVRRGLGPVLGGDRNQFDDAYFFVRYADHVLAGHGISWNRDGLGTYGCTSLLHLLLVIPVRALLPLTPSATIVLTSWLAGLAFLLVLIKACVTSLESPSLRDPLLIAAAILPFLVLNDRLMFHATTGMDTMLALLTNASLIWALTRFLNGAGPRTFWVMLGVAYLNFLARPDNLVFSGMLPVLGLLWLAPRERERWRWIGRYVAALAGVLIVDGWIKYLWLGDIVPLSFFAKSRTVWGDEFFGAYRLNPVTQLVDWTGIVAPFLVLLVIGFQNDRSWYRRSGVFLIPVGILSAYLLLRIPVMGHLGRFTATTLPYVVVAALLSIDHLVRNEVPRAAWLGRRLLVAVSLVFVASWGIRQAEQVYAGRLSASAAREFDLETRRFLMYGLAVEQRGRWRSFDAILAMMRDLPPGVLWAAGEHGFVSAHAPDVDIVDFNGLHDREIAHNGFSSEYLLGREPDVIWFPHFSFQTWIKDVWDDEAFWRDYEYYPHAFEYGLALRKTSPHHTAILTSFRTAWRDHYADPDPSPDRVASLQELHRQIAAITAPTFEEMLADPEFGAAR